MSDRLEINRAHIDKIDGGYLGWCFVFVLLEVDSEARLIEIEKQARALRSESNLPIFDQVVRGYSLLTLRTARVSKRGKRDLQETVQALADQGFRELANILLMTRGIR